MTEQAEMGHNNPPSDVELLIERLNFDYIQLMQRRDELSEAASRAPGKITNSDEEGKVTDFVKQINALVAKSKATFKLEKEPFLEGGRVVGAFFDKVSAPMESVKKDMINRLSAYQREQAAIERKAREAAERKAREEAEAARLAAEARAASIESDTDMSAAIEAEDVARKAEYEAAAAQKATEVKAAGMHTGRGDYGGSSSLATRWDFAELDRTTLDLEALRQHIPQDALEKAVRAFIKSGGRKLAGVRVFENQKTVVR